MIRNVETGHVTVKVTVDVTTNLNEMNLVQTMNYNEALTTLRNIRQALSCESAKTKSHIDIESGEYYYHISCRLMSVMESVDVIGKYEIDASILLTGSSIAESSTELVKVVHDIETLCRELKR